MLVTEELISQVRAMLAEHKSHREIAEELNVGKTTVGKWIRRYIVDGEEISYDRPNNFAKYNEERASRIEQAKREQASEVVMNENPVKCTSSLSRTCIYGRADAHVDADKCNFIGCTGCSRVKMSPQKPHVPTRDENWTTCYFYQKVSRTNRRRKIIFNPNVTR